MAPRAEGARSAASDTRVLRLAGRRPADGDRISGIVLVLSAIALTVVMVRSARSAAEAASAEASTIATAEAADAAGAPESRGRLRATAIAMAGLLVLLVGGHHFVEAASRIALSIGMSERVVGLTIVAVGTSLPELATSVIAAARGHSDIAIGNVVGSNIFNVLLSRRRGPRAPAVRDRARLPARRGRDDRAHAPRIGLHALRADLRALGGRRAPVRVRRVRGAGRRVLTRRAP